MQLHVHVRMLCRIHARFVVIVSGEEQSVRVWVQGPRFGFLMRLGVPYLIRRQKVCMSRRGLVRKNVPPRRVSRSGNFQLGVLQCPSLLVVLFSLLCYLGQAVKLENNWVGYNWRKQKGLGCGFSWGAFQGEDLFSSLAVSGDWVKKGVVPHSVVGPWGFLVLVLICVWAWPSYRATHGKAVLGTALVVVEDYRSPDEALVC